MPPVKWYISVTFMSETRRLKAIDSHTGGEIVELLFRIREEQNTTLVMATHDAQLAARAPRTIELVDGEMVDRSIG